MRIGLILAGGMGKGAYQVGALKAIERYFSHDTIKYISAASVGVLNGYGFSCGKVDKIEQIWKAINNDIDAIYISDLIKSNFLRKAITDISEEDIEASNFIFPLLTLNFKKRELHYIDVVEIESKERRSELLRASVAVPVFSRPVVIDGVKYYDGGTIENVPSNSIKQFDNDIDFYIAIYFDTNIKIFDDPYFEKKTLKICFVDETRVKNATCLTYEAIVKMIDEGEEKTSEMLDYVFNGESNDIAYLQERIDYLNSLEFEEKTKFFTTSHALSTLNGIAKHFVKKKK